jgi:hypothetical protein
MPKVDYDYKLLEIDVHTQFPVQPTRFIVPSKTWWPELNWVGERKLRSDGTEVLKSKTGVVMTPAYEGGQFSSPGITLIVTEDVVVFSFTEGMTQTKWDMFRVEFAHALMKK